MKRPGQQLPAKGKPKRVHSDGNLPRKPAPAPLDGKTDSKPARPSATDEALKSQALFPEENPNPVLRVGEDGTLQYANPASRPLLEKWGCQPGQPIPEKLRQAVDKAAALGGILEWEEACEKTIYSFLITPVAGRKYVNLYGRDITEWCRAEAQLREMSQRLAYHVEHSPLAVIEWGPDMRLIRWSGAAERVFGWKAEEVLGKRIEDFRWVYEADQPQVAEVAEDLRTGSNPRRFSTNRNYRKDGSVVDCEWYSSSLVDQSGELQSILSLVLDVTERHRAEEALRESEAQFHALADSIPNLAWWARGDGYITWFNRRWYEYTGTTPEQVEGWGWQSVHDPEMLPSVRERWKASIANGVPFEMEFPLRGADGQFRWFLTRIVPVQDTSGKVVRWFGTNTDFTEARQAREVLARSKEELERLVAERTVALQESTDQLNSFVYTLAHDLRAPLRAQAAFALVLSEEFGDVLGETGRDYARKIAASAERQGALLSDLLKHISLTRSEFPLEPLDLGAALKEAQTELVLEVHQKGARIELGPVQPQVLANASSLHLVLTNLISNALKFVAPGVSPRVRIWSEPRGDFVRLWVADNGVGIPAQHMHKLFGMFQRLHSSPQYPGTGIGLAIVKKAIERMGGQVGVESQAGVGSRFWVELRKAMPGTGTAEPQELWPPSTPQ